MTIDTDTYSDQLRRKLVDVTGRRLLVSRIGGSDQEADLSEPTNTGGLGRIRHFRRHAGRDWVSNPLPIDPASSRLGLPQSDEIRSQVFQNAGCNWRCWYCFVPFELLAASPTRSQWVTARDLVESYARLDVRPPILDLSGGQPELTPEWVIWTMDALEDFGIDRDVYLWSDDNLSNDYFWRFLSRSQIERIASYRNYGRVGCFKGIDPASFSFNTAASASGFDRQFALFERYLQEGFDIYAYVTLTHPFSGSVRDVVARFVDKLQAVDASLPLRTVPLEIAEFIPVVPRLDGQRRESINRSQFEALDAWSQEMTMRFSSQDRALPIHEVRWARH